MTTEPAPARKGLSILTRIFLGLLFILVAVGGMAAFQPDEFRVTRQGTINAPVDAVFAKINNLSEWKSWSPWDKLDPNQKNTYEGPAAGVGAKQTWAGNAAVGEGSVTITESKPNELIKIDLEMIKPFQAQNKVDFTFKPTEAGTLLTWTLDGKNNFAAKVMGLFMNMDKMLGDQFEEGFAGLNKALQSTATPEATTPTP